MAWILSLHKAAKLCWFEYTVSRYPHGEPGSMLRGLKYLAITATALNVREMHETLHVASAFRYPQAELKPCGIKPELF